MVFKEKLKENYLCLLPSYRLSICFNLGKSIVHKLSLKRRSSYMISCQEKDGMSCIE